MERLHISASRKGARAIVTAVGEAYDLPTEYTMTSENV